MNCHGCDDERCLEVFRCDHCRESKRACQHRAGGFEKTWDGLVLCEECHYELVTGVRLYSKFTNHRVRQMREAM